MAWLCGVDGFKEKWRTVLGNFATGEVRLMDLALKEILNLPESSRESRTFRVGLRALAR